MDEPLRPAKPEAWFGVIQAGVRERESTAQIWERIHGYAQDQGLSVPSDMFTQVNRLRSTAAGLRNGSEQFSRAAPSDAITNEMIGTQIYRRASDELQKIAQLYHVRFEMVTATLAGEQQTGWYTLDYGGSLPATAGELQDDLEAYGQGLTDGYGQVYMGIGRVEIGAY